MSKVKEKCIKFLIMNGYIYSNEIDTDITTYTTYTKVGACAIDIDEDEIVLIDDTGDFLHLPLNYYALIGALIEHRQIAVDYKSIN